MEKKATSDVHTGESIARMLRVLSSSFRSLSLSRARLRVYIMERERESLRVVFQAYDLVF